MKFSACGWWFDDITCYEKAKAMGFDGIEKLSWKDLDLDEHAAAIKKAGITSTGIIVESHDEKIASYLAWNHGIVCDDTFEPMLEALDETIAAAKKLGVPNIILTTGNELKYVPRAEQHRNIVEVLRAMAPIAAEAGLQIVLEALNSKINHKGYYLDSSAETFEIIREVNMPNVKMLFDIYHMQVMEGNIINTITDNIEYIGHFHMADLPGRAQPGTGEINYINIIKAIKEAGYDGWMSFECKRTVELDELEKQLQPILALK